MVICSGPLIPMAQAACPIPPAGPFPLPPGLCAISSVSAIPYQRYPPPPLLTNGHILTTTPPPISCAPDISSSSIIRRNQTPSPHTTNSTDSNLSENSIITYTPVPTNFVPITTSLPPSVVPYTTTVVQCKVPNQSVTTSNLVPNNPGIYASIPPSAIVPCQQRIINGPSVLQCTSGVCQITPTAVFSNRTMEICPISSSPILSNSTAVYPVMPHLSITQNVCAAATAWKQSYGMEQVWQCEFRKFFLQFSPHVWMLLPVNTKPTGVWHANVDSAKVRFCCENCGHGWTSMKGRVAFWFILNPATNEGLVCLKLYGQQCDRCKTGNYEPAMWYPEEVVKVLVNIYNRVGQVYYGFQQAPYHKTRRPGKPRTPHNSELCQACKDGVCAERR